MTEIPIQPSIKAFFAKALPKGAGTHILALGEHHTQREPADYLNEHLDELTREHDVGTIGIEFPMYMNVVLWAYADGKLDRMLGSRERAKAYVHAMFELNSEAMYADASDGWAELAIKAIDSGVRVVAFDSRQKLQEEQEQIRETQNFLNRHIEQAAQAAGQLPAEFRQRMFLDKTLRRQVIEDSSLQELKDELEQNGEEKLIRLVKDDGYKSLDEYRVDAIVSDSDACFAFQEIERLIKRNPHYGSRLAGLEAIVDEGMKLVPPIPSDALSAAIFNAASIPGKNRITIGGLSHIDGIGSVDEATPIDIIHGTFHRHLASMRTAENNSPHVTRAVIATVANAKFMQQELNAQRRNSSMLRDETAPMLITLDNAEVKNLPTPKTNHPRVVSFAHKISYTHSKRHRHVLDHTVRANPLLLSGVKAAHDDVFADWNPGQQQQIQR